eukprot:7841095-Pyramimonas_sp.AAC.1
MDTLRRGVPPPTSGAALLAPRAQAESPAASTSESAPPHDTPIAGAESAPCERAVRVGDGAPPMQSGRAWISELAALAYACTSSKLRPWSKISSIVSPTDCGGTALGNLEPPA